MEVEGGALDQAPVRDKKRFEVKKVCVLVLVCVGCL